MESTVGAGPAEDGPSEGLTRAPVARRLFIIPRLGWRLSAPEDTPAISDGSSDIAVVGVSARP